MWNTITIYRSRTWDGLEWIWPSLLHGCLDHSLPFGKGLSPSRLSTPTPGAQMGTWKQPLQTRGNELSPWTVGDLPGLPPPFPSRVNLNADSHGVSGAFSFFNHRRWPPRPGKTEDASWAGTSQPHSTQVSIATSYCCPGWAQSTRLGRKSVEWR